MTAAVLSVVGALLGGGLIGAILTNAREWRKTGTDADKTSTETALDVMREIREMHRESTEKLAAAVDYAQELRDHIYEQKPPPPPPWPDELKNR